jgi:hypothetical protein
VSDRVVRFPGASWQEIEALPQPPRWTVQRTIFHLLDEPVPTLADPFPSGGRSLGWLPAWLPVASLTPCLQRSFARLSDLLPCRWWPVSLASG